MAQGRAKIRLFVGRPLGQGAVVEAAAAQAHYLLNVMRLGPGARVLLFNGVDGEWEAEIAQAGRRSVRLLCRGRVRPQAGAPDLWLLFAPLRKARTDFIVEKATELGVARLLPVATARTRGERVNLARLEAHAIEAAEQSGRLDLPTIAAPAPLERILADWDGNRRLFFCDESGTAPPMATTLAALPPGPAAILVGPEGGFEAGERESLVGRPGVHPVGLGPRILRAETAALAAVALWQAAHGDWR